MDTKANVMSFVHVKSQTSPFVIAEFACNLIHVCLKKRLRSGLLIKQRGNQNINK